MNHECVQLSTTLHSWTLLLDCYGQLESREKSLPPTQLFDINFFSHELRYNETESPEGRWLYPPINIADAMVHSTDFDFVAVSRRGR